MPTPPLRPPPVRGPSRFDLENAARAIETVRSALPIFTLGPPLFRRGPAGELQIDVPLMYLNFAMDRVHYDPHLNAPSPKGRPVKVWGMAVDEESVRSGLEDALREAWVVEAAEFREPEDAWVVPIAWKNVIIAHIKVSSDGGELIPDYGLTEEVRRHAL